MTRGAWVAWALLVAPPVHAAKPPDVPSRESHIGFEWRELAAVPDLDIRPTAAKAWLASLGRTSSPGAEWVTEM